MSSGEDFLASVVLVALGVALGWGSFAIWPSEFLNTAFLQMTPMMVVQFLSSILMGLFAGGVALFVFFGLIQSLNK